MSQIGSFALLLALVLSAYSFLAGLVSLIRKGIGAQRLGETARRAGIATFATVFLAALVLVIAAFQDQFSIAYIFHHSNRDLPGAYKFATLWSGQEGSLLFWSLLLATYGFVLRLRHKTDQRLFAYASVVIAAVQIFFLLLLNFAAHPFAVMQGELPPDGNGLNPLLQYPEMVIHPPMLYLGYVGFTIPFAFAFGALIMRYPGAKWIHITRRWTMVTWGFLTVGIFLGAHWAYSVLGWGGYWGWDPVENASLMPWLTGTAFLHSVMMQEKRGMLKIWNVTLICGTFALALLGTFLVRSGILESIHAFGASTVGGPLLGLIAVVVCTSIRLVVWRLDDLRSSKRIESLASREAVFLINNLLLIGLAAIIFWGTFFPLISELFTGEKASLAAPWFDRYATPLAILLVLFTGIGPLLAWRQVSWASAKRVFAVPRAIALGAGLLLVVFTDAEKNLWALFLF